MSRRSFDIERRQVDERARLTRELERHRAMLDALESCIKSDIPLGATGAAVAESGARIAAHAARCDAFDYVARELKELS